MAQPFVNIVIITYNGYSYTEACLLSLLKSDYHNFKFFLVDNGSTKKDYEFFLNKYRKNKKIEFIRIDKNRGFAAGCNAALKRIKKGYIAFVNNDTLVAKDWLNPIISYMENNPEVGMCQPKIIDLKKKEYFEYAGAAGGFMDVYGFPFARGRVFFTIEKDKGQYDDIVDIVWTGTVLVTKKEVIDKVGYFDDIFFLYAEEADLCWRIHHAGFRIVYIPNSIIYHYGSTKNIVDKTFYNHRNGLIMLIKNYSVFQLIRYLPVRLLLDLIAFFYYLVIYFPNCWEMTKAYLSLFYLMPKVLHQRADINKLKRINGKPKYKYHLYKKSIIIDYFLKGKKNFKELNYEF